MIVLSYQTWYFYINTDVVAGKYSTENGEVKRFQMAVDLKRLYKDFMDNGSEEQRECCEWLIKHLFQRALKSVYKRPFFRSYSHQDKSQKACDFAQDAMREIWEKRNNLRTAAAFLKWCQQILDNKLKDCVRKEGDKVSIDDDGWPNEPSARYVYLKKDIIISHFKLDEDADYEATLDFLSPFQSVGSTPALPVEEDMIQEEVYQLVSRSSKCTAWSKEVVLKRLKVGLKDKEIAEQHGKTVGSVTKEFERDKKHLEKDPDVIKWRDDYLKGN
jgi:DNA-directed RNA polymerase specialized sigma24 family protein